MKTFYRVGKCSLFLPAPGYPQVISLLYFIVRLMRFYIINCKNGHKEYSDINSNHNYLPLFPFVVKTQ